MADYSVYARIRDSVGLNDNKVSIKAGISRSSLGDWKHGRSNPKYDKLEKIAAVLGVPLSYLTSDYSEIQDEARDTYKRLNENEMRTDGFYLDQDALDLMQIMADRPEYKTLFKAAANVKPEDIEKVKAVLDAFKKDDYAE